MTPTPSFTSVTDALNTLDSLGTAGESHGLLCALLSFNNKIREQAWVDSLLSSHIEPSDAKAQQAYKLLTELFQVTHKAFAEEDFDFPILLPDDDLPLEDRIDALSEWCQGYLTGLHLLGVKLDNPAFAPDLKEALDDLLAISQVELTPEDQKDAESEVRFMQLVEHVKAAVLVVSGEFQLAVAQREHETVH